MNAASREALQKVLAGIERKSRRRKTSTRFPMSSIVFGGGLALADYLLIDFVPRSWSTLLPGGLDQAASLTGNAATVWRFCLLAHRFQAFVPYAIVIASVLLFVLASRSRTFRIVSWLGAVGILLVNAWIMATVMYSSWTATAEASGLDLPLSL